MDRDGSTEFEYRLYFPIDACDEWVRPPFNGQDICFRKPNLSDPKATDLEMQRASESLRERTTH